MQTLDVLLQVSGLTPGRVAAIIPGILGLISVVLGWMALARSASRPGPARTKAIVALVLALTCVVLSGMHLVRTTGGFGTGSGKAGAIVAMVIGTVGLVMGGRAWSRFRFNK
jgi:hypothetical protein